MQSNQATSRAIDIKEVCRQTGKAKSSVWAALNPKNRRFDASFPRPFRLSDGGRSVRWYEHEIQAWLEKRAANNRI